MASHAHDSEPTAEHPQPGTTPVELSRLTPSTERLTHEDPISPMSPATETFATPPTSARHSTFAPHTKDTSEEHAVAGTQEDAAAAPDTTSHRPDTTTNTQLEAAEPAVEEKQPPPADSEITSSPSPSKGGIHPPTSHSALHLPADARTDNGAADTVHLTLLHPSGLRHPFVLNPQYLRSHHVAAADDPWQISVYTLKKLVWRDWRAEWEARPLTPGAVRLISFGRMLEERNVLGGEYCFFFFFFFCQRGWGGRLMCRNVRSEFLADGE